MYTNRLSDAEVDTFVGYWYGPGKAGKRDWFVQIDIHGGANSAVAENPSESSAYAHRDKLFLWQFYDRVDLSATYPADGFAFLGGFVASTGASADRGMYFNYPDPSMGQDEAQARYWGGNLARLQRVKADVDPEEVLSRAYARRGVEALL